MESEKSEKPLSPKKNSLLESVIGSAKAYNDSINRMGKSISKIFQYDAEKNAQPFKTNVLLEDIRELQERMEKSQPPLWTQYAILFLTIASTIIGIWALLHSYGII